MSRKIAALSSRLTSPKILFGCDLRTLALVRCCLGLLIIADLIIRARDLTAHYTDGGVLPRAALLGIFDETGASLHLISGTFWIQCTLFLIAGSIAFALTVGYRARTAALLSWVLLISLDARNSYVSQGGDMLLRVLVFWAIFLPISARYSIDAALNTEDSNNNAYFSIATAAILIQATSVYFFTALLKTSPVWIPDGTAVYYALHNDTLITPFGIWLRQFDGVMQLLTYFVWYLELATPLLLFAPIFHLQIRLIGLFLLIAMHIGFFVNMDIGLFPMISITSLLAFTPGSIWDWIEARVRTPERTGIKMFYDGDCTFCRKICLLLRTFLLPSGIPITPAQSDAAIFEQMQTHNSWVVLDHENKSHVRWPAVALVFRRSVLFAPLGILFSSRALAGLGDRIYAWVARNRAARITAVLLPYRRLRHELDWLTSTVVGFLLFSIVWINFASLDSFSYPPPQQIKNIASTLRLRQNWNMFAPGPSKGGPWFVARGELFDGMPVDLYLDKLAEPTWRKWDYLPVNNSTFRRRKFFARLAVEKTIKLRPYYVQHLCRVWNREHQSPLKSITLHMTMEWTQLEHQPAKLDEHLLWRAECGEDPEAQIRALMDGTMRTTSIED